MHLHSAPKQAEFEVVTMEFNAASESLYAHSGGENGVCSTNLLRHFSGRRRSESLGTNRARKPIFARGLTHWGLTLNTPLAFRPPPQLGDSPLEFEGEQQDSSQWLTVSSEMLQREVVITVH